MTSRVGPRFPVENIGTTITCPRARLRASIDTTRTKRGWCGSLGCPGVYARQISPRRGLATVSVWSRAQLALGRASPQGIPRATFALRHTVGLGELPFDRQFQLLCPPQTQCRVDHCAAIIIRVGSHMRVDRCEQVGVDGCGYLRTATCGRAAYHADTIADTSPDTSPDISLSQK